MHVVTFCALKNILQITTIVSLSCYIVAIATCVKKKKSYKPYVSFLGMHVFSIVSGFAISIATNSIPVPVACCFFQSVMTVFLPVIIAMRGDYPTINPKIKRRAGLCVLVAICVLLIKGIKEMDTEFKWNSAWEAPKYYPVELLNGAFMLEGKGERSLLSCCTGGRGWGASAHEYGGKKRPLPEGLYAYWYSFAEDKFYEGSFKLPRDKMLALFREGFNQHRAKNRMTYNAITVGFAPGGTVAVWLQGYRRSGKSVEIGYFKAKEAKRLSWEKFFDTFYYRDFKERAWTVYRQEMLKGLGAIDNLERNGIPFGVWDTYRERFNFRPVMVYEDTTCVTDEIYLEYYNGEIETISLEGLKENPYEKRAMVKYIEVYWSFGQTIRELILEFDEQEIFEAYRKIHDGNPDCPVELQICFDEENHYVHLFLARTKKDDFDRVQLRHAKIKWFPVDEIKRYRFEVFKKKNNN